MLYFNLLNSIPKKMPSRKPPSPDDRSNTLKIEKTGERIKSKNSSLWDTCAKMDSSESVMKFPVILYQNGKTTELFARSSSSYLKQAEFMNGWSLLLPLPALKQLWLKFIFAGVKVGCLREKKLLHYESESPFFPDDYLGSSAFDHHVTELIASRKLIKLKRPPSKQPQWPFWMTHPNSVLDKDQSNLIVLRGIKWKWWINNSLAHLQTKDEISQKLYRNLLSLNSKISESDWNNQTYLEIKIKVDQKGKFAPLSPIYIHKSMAVSKLPPSSPEFNLDEFEFVGFISSSDISLRHAKAFGIGFCRISGIIDRFSEYRTRRSISVLCQGQTGVWVSASIYI